MMSETWVVSVVAWMMCLFGELVQRDDSDVNAGKKYDLPYKKYRYAR